MKNVVTFHFLAPVNLDVSDRRFPETHIIPCSNTASAELWAKKYLSRYFEQSFELTNIEID